MKLRESCVIEQHVDRLFKSVEPKLGAWHAGRGGTDVVLLIDMENAYGRAFRSTCL